MNTSRHSPSPWKVEYDPKKSWVIRSRDGYSLASIPYDEHYGNSAIDAANAALIAAAPELLDVIETLLIYINLKNDLSCFTIKNTPEVVALFEGLPMLLRRARG